MVGQMGGTEPPSMVYWVVVWYSVIWYGMYGMVWYGMVWYRDELRTFE